jgi:hypothetical protein
MSGFAYSVRTYRFLAGPLLAGVVCAAAYGAPAPAPAFSTPPDFSSNNAGWIAQGVNFQLPPHGPHQVINDPAYPFKPPGRGEAPTFRVADITNPILQQWAQDELTKRNTRIIKTKRAGAPGEQSIEREGRYVRREAGLPGSRRGKARR